MPILDFFETPITTGSGSQSIGLPPEAPKDVTRTSLGNDGPWVPKSEKSQLSSIKVPPDKFEEPQTQKERYVATLNQ